MVLSDAQLARTQKQDDMRAAVQRCLIGLALGGPELAVPLCTPAAPAPFLLQALSVVCLLLLLGWWIWPGGRSSLLPLDDRW